MPSITTILGPGINASDPFFGAALKTKWACQHIKDISNSIFETFFAGGRKGDEIIQDSNLGTEDKPPKWRYINRIREDTVMLTTYAIHDLRSALDHIACAISSAPKRQKAEFIIGDSLEEFNRLATQREKEGRLCSAAINFMRSFQPYRGGNDALWVLHRLNILDKHRMLILVEPRGQRRPYWDHGPPDYGASDWERFEGREDFYTRPLPDYPNAKTHTRFSVAFDKVGTIENRPVEKRLILDGVR